MVVEDLAVATYDWDVPRHAREDDRGHKHDDEDNPGVWSALFDVVVMTGVADGAPTKRSGRSLDEQPSPFYTSLELLRHRCSFAALTIVSSRQCRRPPGR